MEQESGCCDALSKHRRAGRGRRATTRGASETATEDVCRLYDRGSSSPHRAHFSIRICRRGSTPHRTHAPRPRAVHFARHSCIAARASPPASAAMPLGASTHSRMQCSPTSPSTTTDSTPRTPRTLPKAPSAALSQRALHDALQSESESELSLIRRGEQAALARINHLKASNIALERNLHLHAASLTAQREMLNDLASKVAHLTQLLSKPGGQHSEPSNPEALYTAVMQLHHRIQRGTTPSSPPKVRGALSPMVE